MKMRRRCRACGKVLKDSDSIRNGYGPKCYASIFGKPDKKTRPKTHEEIMAEYVCDGQMSIYDFLDIKKEPEENE